MSKTEAVAGLGVSTQDVAWVVVLAVCVFMMVAPFVFWAIVMVTRRKERVVDDRAIATVPSGPEQAGVRPELDERAS